MKALFSQFQNAKFPRKIQKDGAPSGQPEAWQKAMQGFDVRGKYNDSKEKDEGRMEQQAVDAINGIILSVPKALQPVVTQYLNEKISAENFKDFDIQHMSMEFLTMVEIDHMRDTFRQEIDDFLIATYVENDEHFLNKDAILGRIEKKLLDKQSALTSESGNTYFKSPEIVVDGDTLKDSLSIADGNLYLDINYIKYQDSFAIDSVQTDIILYNKEELGKMGLTPQQAKNALLRALKYEKRDDGVYRASLNENSAENRIAQIFQSEKQKPKDETPKTASSEAKKNLETARKLQEEQEKFDAMSAEEKQAYIEKQQTEAAATATASLAAGGTVATNKSEKKNQLSTGLKQLQNDGRSLLENKSYENVLAEVKPEADDTDVINENGGLKGVQKIQSAINKAMNKFSAENFTALNADGIYGPKTKQALEALQQKMAVAKTVRVENVVKNASSNPIGIQKKEVNLVADIPKSEAIAAIPVVKNETFANDKKKSESEGIKIEQAVAAETQFSAENYGKRDLFKKLKAREDLTDKDARKIAKVVAKTAKNLSDGPSVLNYHESNVKIGKDKAIDIRENGGQLYFAFSEAGNAIEEKKYIDPTCPDCFYYYDPVFDQMRPDKVKIYDKFLPEEDSDKMWA